MSLVDPETPAVTRGSALMVRAASVATRLRGCRPCPTSLRVPRGSDRVVAGVASGWADRWGVEPTVVRAAVGLLTLAGGLGVVLYGGAAILSTDSVPAPVASPLSSADRWRRELAIGCATAAVLVALPGRSGCGRATGS